MIYVYTSLLNGWDNLRPPATPADEFVRYICFTNVPNLPRVYPWEYRPAYAAGDACRSVRVPKILPHLMLPEDAEYSIYHDGNFQLRQDPHTVIGHLLSRHQWAAHKHPCRNCLYEEAEVILEDPGMAGWRAQKPEEERIEPIRREIARYRAEGFPEHAGLWANGMIVRRHTPEVARLNELWWEHFSAGCERDQISFPAARAKAGLEIRTIPENIWASPWILFHWHAAFKTREDNPDFWPERSRIRQRLADLARLTGSTGGIAYPEY